MKNSRDSLNRTTIKNSSNINNLNKLSTRTYGHTCDKSGQDIYTLMLHRSATTQRKYKNLTLAFACTVGVTQYRQLFYRTKG